MAHASHFITAALLAVTASSHAATVSNTFDENAIQGNTVEQSGTFASGTLGGSAANVTDFATFDAAVETAAGLGFGGVLNFDAQLNTDDQNLPGISSPISLDYGSKNLSVSYTTADSSAAIRQGNLSNRTPISAGNGATPGFAMTFVNETTNSDATFTFGAITGGDPGEGVTSVGLTFLSRTSRDYGDVIATATFSGGGSASSSVATTGVNGSFTAGTNDTFFGFIAPTGETITSLKIDPTSTVGYSIDDLAFITTATSAPIPEPASVMLLATGTMMLLGRRRRA